MRIVIRLLVMACFFCPLRIEAQTDESTAQAAFEEAKELYKEGKFSEAAKKFREANALRPSWKLLYNIGQSEVAAKRNGLGLEAFEKYLTLGGDEISEERHQAVLSEIERLRPIVGFVEVDVTAESTVYVDDLERGKAPLPGPVPIAASVEHTIRVEMAGETRLERVVKVTGGQTITVQEASADGPVEENEPDTPVPEENSDGGDPVSGEDAPPAKSPLIRTGWISLGVGGAVLVAGTITGAVALSKSKTLESECPNSVCPDNSSQDLMASIDGLSLATDILLPLGGTLAVAGIVMVLVGKNKDGKNRDVSMAVTPLFSQSYGGFAIEGRF